MKFLFLFLLLGVISTSGCSKKKSAPPKVSETASETETAVSTDSAIPSQANEPARAAQPRQRPTPATPPAPRAVTIESESLVGIVHPFMTQQLRKFVEENGRMPKDFAEFASARMDSVPRAPEGLKFAIDPTTMEVKLVRK